MTATVKEFCRINGVDENSHSIVDILYNALLGGDCYGDISRDSKQGAEIKAPIPDGFKGTADS